MGVDICGGGGIGVAQLVGSGDEVNAVGNHRGCRRVSEGVGMDVRQVMPVAELGKPVGNVVRVHDASVIVGEDEIRSDPSVTAKQPQAVLLIVPPLQKLQALGSQHQGSGLARLGFALIGSLGGRIQQRIPRQYAAARPNIWLPDVPWEHGHGKQSGHALLSPGRHFSSVLSQSQAVQGQDLEMI